MGDHAGRHVDTSRPVDASQSQRSDGADSGFGGRFTQRSIAEPIPTRFDLEDLPDYFVSAPARGQLSF